MSFAAVSVACILVNWNSWRDTDACLSALREQEVGGLRVVVVDNGSTNESVRELRERHPWVTVVESGENGGFAKGCNLGARHAGDVEFLWFLNNDTVCPPDTLRLLLAAAAAEPEALVGAELRFAHRPDRVQAWGGGTVSRWSGVSRHFAGPEPLGPDAYLTFACVLVRRHLWERLGGLYDGAFMYFEDSDFCLRAKTAGATLAVAAGTAILHKEGGSQAGPGLRMIRAFTAAGVHFMRRHCPLPWVGVGVFVALRVAKRLVRGRLREVEAVVGGAVEGLR